MSVALFLGSLVPDLFDDGPPRTEPPIEGAAASGGCFEEGGGGSEVTSVSRVAMGMPGS